jgi:FHA domain
MNSLMLIRKERSVPAPKPPARPPAPKGIEAPGGGGVAPGGMVCPGTSRTLSSPRLAGAGPSLDETALEAPAQKMLRKPASLGGKSIHLTIVEGNDKGRSFDVTGIGTYTIGRTECDIVLEDEKVSRKHASIVIIREAQYAVNDLASRNGTFVNGIRLTRRNLQHNDLVRIGNTTLRFTVFDGPVPLES